MVLNAGRIVEFDAPGVLLTNPQSQFYALCKASGRDEFNALLRISHASSYYSSAFTFRPPSTPGTPKAALKSPSPEEKPAHYAGYGGETTPETPYHEQEGSHYHDAEASHSRYDTGREAEDRDAEGRAEQAHGKGVGHKDQDRSSPGASEWHTNGEFFDEVGNDDVDELPRYEPDEEGHVAPVEKATYSGGSRRPSQDGNGHQDRGLERAGSSRQAAASADLARNEEDHEGGYVLAGREDSDRR